MVDSPDGDNLAFAGMFPKVTTEVPVDAGGGLIEKRLPFPSLVLQDDGALSATFKKVQGVPGKRNRDPLERALGLGGGYE